MNMKVEVYIQVSSNTPYIITILSIIVQVELARSACITIMGKLAF